MRSLAAALFACALLLRIAIPAGFMPAQTAHGIVVRMCDGMSSGKTMVIDVGLPDKGKHHPEHEKPTVPCAFAGLSAPVLGADPALAMVLPAMVLGEFALPPPSDVRLADADFLTPPLRGPPARA
ncbi:hypothetical protein [Sphingomonas pokkalii]|uniref:DUF2946 domain-containing protein n=1 Tax=Sphingomonas pokkalii TaxID=2175090 RepID=A0A2U0SCA7_9SPHN|nr:hypothetical protein [Sphingomonas pokkalii]PVX29007.1 hypothetical protein DD559_06385 [Sphingomonas pokkalii]